MQNEILTGEKEIEQKKMKMSIKSLNKWIKDAKYPEIIRALERTEEDVKKQNRFAGVIGSPSLKIKGEKKTFNQIVSEVLRIHVQDIYWDSDDSAVILYYDL